MRTTVALFSLMSLSLSPIVRGQTVPVFYETMGTVSATTSISVHESNNGFDNDALTMTDGGAANPADIRATSVSSGYTNSLNNAASGGANIFFTGTEGDRGFAIQGIDATGFEDLVLEFGYRKDSGSANGIFVVQWSTDAGANWNDLTVNGLPAENATARWYLLSASVPEGAQSAGLWIRWIKSGSVAFRVDDVLLSGTPPAGNFPPTLGGASASAISRTTATLNSSVTFAGGLDITERGFFYSSTSGFTPPGQGVKVSESGTFEAGAFSEEISDLDAETTYYFVAFATNDEDTTYSAESSFTTLKAAPADALVYYSFFGSVNAPDIVADDITASVFAASTGNVTHAWFQPGDWEALGAEQPYALGSGGWNAELRENAKYFVFTLEADTDASMTITNISFLHRRQTTGGPLTVGVSINGTSVYEDDIENLATTYVVDIPVNGFSGVEQAEIRIEGWAGGTGEYRIDNILVQGTTSGSGPGPDPDAVEVTGFTVVGGNPAATFTAVAGRSYYLVYTTDLTEISTVTPPVLGEWEVAASITDATAGIQTLTDTSATDAARFYGILETLSPLP